jgi:hypothetical protein
MGLNALGLAFISRVILSTLDVLEYFHVLQFGFSSSSSASGTSV